MNTVLPEWAQRAPAFLVPDPTPRAISLGKKSFNSSSPLPWAPQATTQPKLGTKVFQMPVRPRSFNWTGPLHASQVPTGTTSFPQKGSARLWSLNGVDQEELEEGGIWWKSTCQPEILFGENAVHALRQSPGVGGGAGHRGAQNEFPASSGWEVGHRVLPSLLRGAHSLQFLLRWSHGCSLE